MINTKTNRNLITFIVLTLFLLDAKSWWYVSIVRCQTKMYNCKCSYLCWYFFLLFSFFFVDWISLYCVASTDECKYTWYFWKTFPWVSWILIQRAISLCICDISDAPRYYFLFHLILNLSKISFSKIFFIFSFSSFVKSLVFICLKVL